MKIHSDIVLDIFHQKKILTLNEITSLLHCSNTTARRRVKIWQTYTSYNFNGRYYTLENIPQFNKHGIWKYQNVYFSKWGTLQKTLQHLIENAQAGLNTIEANKLLGVQVQNFLSQQFLQHKQFYREKHKGMYIYYSKDPSIFQVQKQARHQSFAAVSVSELPTHAEAVIILVELIKHPHDTLKQLSFHVKYKKINVPLGKIRNLLGYHGILKKTLEDKH